ncbi:hypothetical protein ACQR5W_11730 [Xanthomonas sacchari]
MKHSKNYHLVGLEGRINGLSPSGMRYGLDVFPIFREVNKFGVLVTYGFCADQLVPIFPEGQRPCGESYEQLMGRLRAGVVA